MNQENLVLPKKYQLIFEIKIQLSFFQTQKNEFGGRNEKFDVVNIFLL